MKGQAFCIQCGKTDAKLFDGLCSSCFIDNLSLICVPDDLKLTVCTKCGSIQKKTRWTDSHLPLEGQLAETILEKIKVDKSVSEEKILLKIINTHGTTYTFLIQITGEVLGKEINQEYPAEIKVEKNVCPECSKYASGYYEAVIQLRAYERHPTTYEIQKADSIVKDRIERLSAENRMAYLSQRMQLKEGVDYYLGSYKAARKITKTLKNELGGMIRESPRLMGHDKNTGKDIFRIWISLRLPNFSKGDFVIYNDLIAQIMNFDGNKIYIKDLESKQRISVPWRDYDKLKVIAYKEDIQSVLVSAKTPKYIQILHPETYQPLEIPIISQIPQVEIGEMMEVVEINGLFYLLVD